MALIISNKGTPEVPTALTAMNSAKSIGSVIEGFLEVLTRVLFSQPHALAGLVGSNAENEAHFLDRWLATASRKYASQAAQNQTINPRHTLCYPKSMQISDVFDCTYSKP